VLGGGEAKEGFAWQDTSQQVRVEASLALDTASALLHPRAQPIVAGQLVASPLASLQRQDKGWQASTLAAAAADTDAKRGEMSRQRSRVPVDWPGRRRPLASVCMPTVKGRHLKSLSIHGELQVRQMGEH
jgi:hypothetical protein